MQEEYEISCDPKVHRRLDQAKLPSIISQISHATFWNLFVVVLLATYLCCVNINNCLLILLTKSNCAAIQGIYQIL